MPAEESRICNTLYEIVSANPDLSVSVAAVQALVESIKWNSATTLSQVMLDLEATGEKLKAETKISPISVAAGCDLLIQWARKYQHDVRDFDASRAQIIETGEKLSLRSTEIRNKVVSSGLKFIRNDTTILVHSYSRVVIMMLLKAFKSGIKFTVLATESRPSADNGTKVESVLKEHGIPVKVISDCAVGYFIEKCDMVLVGAEGVVENGGIVNQIGTYLIALAAKASNVPLYVVAESYKFSRMYPLGQEDLEKWNNPPTVDYTPPHLISLLFTDLGILTPTGVSDELIKTYSQS